MSLDTAPISLNPDAILGLKERLRTDIHALHSLGSMILAWQTDDYESGAGPEPSRAVIFSDCSVAIYSALQLPGVEWPDHVLPPAFLLDMFERIDQAELRAELEGSM